MGNEISKSEDSSLLSSTTDYLTSGVLSAVRICILVMIALMWLLELGLRGAVHILSLILRYLS